MEKNVFADLTNEELLQEKKKIQYNKMVNAALVGFCVGISIYGTVKNGLGFFTIVPLLLAYPFIKNGQKIKALTAQIESRGLS